MMPLKQALKIELQEKDYTIFRPCYQLMLPIDYEVIIPEDDSVRLLNQILEGLDYKELYDTYSSMGRNPSVEPKIMFKVIVYGYMNNVYSSRKIESACKRDVNFMWLLSGESAPDHTTINRFRKNRLGEVMEGLFYQFIKILHEIGEVDYENLFVDGTKIEANANKYTFVWKKALEKNEAKMHIKVAGIAEEINKLFFTNFRVSEKTIDEDMYEMITYLNQKKDTENIEFVQGSGKRKSNVQKLTEALETYRERQMKYEESKELFEGRNSYSKTDTDATFMRMKDDHMKNGQLKPAYNVQIGVEGEYVTGVGIFPFRNDTPALIPLLKDMNNHLGICYKNVVADAGYESEENYNYLEGKDISYYIKPLSYEQCKKSSFKTNIGKRENMYYNPQTDEYTCYNGKQLKPIRILNRTSSTGYVSKVTVYECENCSECSCKDKCTKAKGNKQIQVSKDFVEKRNISLENITSEQGILLRINRSIQVEGAFGVLKYDRQFDRFLTRGNQNVKTETLLLCFSYNVNKLHAKIQSDRCGKDLHVPKVA